MAGSHYLRDIETKGIRIMTDKEKLIAQYPEGIPAWMWDRDYTLDHIDSLMRIRREAFKIFARRPKEGKDHA